MSKAAQEGFMLIALLVLIYFIVMEFCRWFNSYKDDGEDDGSQ